MSIPDRDAWAKLARWTPARIALGRTGASLPTREVLAFALAHARARDAVHAPFDPAALSRDLAALGVETVEVASEAVDRPLYLRRPDYGRRLSRASRAALSHRGERVDLAVVVGDGLSATAVHAHAVPLIAAFLPYVQHQAWSLAPVVLARGARVALGDEIGTVLRARVVAVLIGERPGLSSSDSLGVYLTFGPRVGLSDADRNCISNIRAEGLGYKVAAFKLAWLVREAFARSLTGVGLKDASDLELNDGASALARITRAPAPGRR